MIKYAIVFSLYEIIILYDMVNELVRLLPNKICIHYSVNIFVQLGHLLNISIIF